MRAGGENTAEVKSSSINYTQSEVWATKVENGSQKDGRISARNWLDGIYGENATAIKYPTFQGSTYAMNYISISDAYSISRVLTESGNIYGLSSDTDSHMIKNSEWGVCSYLTQSKYGVYDKEIAVNNHNENSGGTSTTKVDGNNLASVYAVTGYNDNEKKWNEYISENENSSSSTGNMYGIYDLSGGLVERTSGYILNENQNLEKYGGIYVTGTSTKYATVYPSNDEGIDDIEKQENNYLLNTKIYGDAIREVSEKGTSNTSWNSDYSRYARGNSSFFSMGGNFTNNIYAGSNSFNCTVGSYHYQHGFRCVLI